MVLGAVLVFGVGALQWREIAVRWRAWELEAEDASTELPAELIAERPGTLRRDALLRFVRTPKGKERLLRTYLAVIEWSNARFTFEGLGAGGDTAFLFLWVDDLLLAQRHEQDWLRPFLEQEDQDAPTTAPFNLFLMPYPTRYSMETESLETALRLQDLLLEVGYDEYPLPDHPGARFSVVSCMDPDPRCRRHLPSPPLGVRHGCLGTSHLVRTSEGSGTRTV